jgi:fatty acid CoA ligase FadD36
VLVHGLPLFHVHGLVLGVLGAMRAGSPLVHTGRPTPAAYARAAEQAGGTVYFGVPTVWGRVAADPAVARALSSARLLVSGSAGLPPTVFRSLEQLAGQGPLERYGMTETLITLAARADGPRRAGWVGGPIAGVQAQVVDDAGAVLPAGEIGHLQVRGRTLFDGYLGRGAAPLTPDGWFDTGDAAEVDVDGRHRIVGRTRDDLIKSGGYRVGAGEIEAALLEHPGVSEAAVVGVPDADLGQRIVAFVVASGVDAQVLVDHVATQLSRHKRPREVRFVDALPRNAMGKIQKARLT